MRRTFTRVAITAAATAGLAASIQVNALSLGEIDVNSALNQRFTATIPLSEITGEDLETVTVSLAANDAYERAGLERPEYLSTLTFDIADNKGHPKVVITSGQIAREPVLNLLIQARWKGGKILRDYVVLLDPPALPARPAAVVAKPAAAATPIIATSPAPVAAAGKPEPVKPASEFFVTAEETRKPAPTPAAKPSALASDAAFDGATSSYGPVAPQQTLWNIATKVRPSAAVSMDQVLLALSQANPDAIQRGTTVSKGAVLRVPSAERMMATPAALAKSRLAALRAGHALPAQGKPAAAEAAKLAKPAVAAKPASSPLAGLSATDAAKLAPATPVIAVPAAAPASSAAATTAKPEADAAALAKPAMDGKPAAAAAAAAAAISPGTANPAGSNPTTPGLAGNNLPSTVSSITSAAPSLPTVAAKPASPPSTAQTAPTEEPGLLDGLGLPALLAALLAIAVAVYLFLRRKKAGDEEVPAPPAPFKPGSTASLKPAASAALSGAAASRLGDNLRHSDTQIIRQPSATQQITQQVEGQPPKSDPVATLLLEPELAASMQSSVKPSAVTHGPDADKASQVHVDTMQIALEGNDPIAEADFHLAYGLYDEAILLLKQAIAKAPMRTDLQVKLAETYFAAGRPLEFQAIAEGLQPQLGASEWSKLAIMGQQICPDAALFKSEGSEGMEADFDLGFDDEPAAPVPPLAKAPAAPTPNPVAFANASSASLAPLSLSLNMDDEDLHDHAPKPAASKNLGLDDPNSIDFMLGQSLTPLGAGLGNSLTALGNSLTAKPEVPLMDFKPMLGDAGLEMPSSKKPQTVDELPALSDGPTITPRGANLVDFSLQDLEVSITPRELATGSTENDVNTKLDLSRAYVEMGDNEMARSLLQEVQSLGNEQQKKEAASLLQRLGSA